MPSGVKLGFYKTHGWGEWLWAAKRAARTGYVALRGSRDSTYGAQEK